MDTAGTIDLAGLTLPELADLMRSFDEEPYHARQIYAWIHRRGATSVAAMTDLSVALRTRLAARATVNAPQVERRDVSTDGTTKYLLGLADHRHIEAVFIPDTPAQTFCVSSQVGCAMRCAFCLTGKMGIVRNLTAGEIVGQVRVLARDQGLLSAPFNIVLMGMGEPLHNYDETMKALRMLTAPEGLGLSPRRITLSTVGVLPALERLAAEEVMPNLAISLHATTDAQRDALVPLNRKYNVADLLDACRRFPVKQRSRITFEYVMLADVNDSPDDARRLAKLLHGIRGKVNLLPLNEAAGIPFRRPAEERVDAFARVLADRGVLVTVRKSRGRDIRAACGQLIVEGADVSPAQRAASLIGS